MKYLHISKYDQCIKQFCDLEYLLCSQLNNNIDSHFLEHLTELKEIQLNNKTSDYLTSALVINELKRQKSILKLANFNTIDYCFDYSLYRLNDFDFSITSSNVQSIKDNYSKIPFNLQW